MLSPKPKKPLFIGNRLVFHQKTEKPSISTDKTSETQPDSLEVHQKKALVEIQTRARQVKRDSEKQDVIENAKIRAETKDKLVAFKPLSDQPKLHPDGHFEQEFNFGDKKLPGKLVFPKDNDPTKPTSYLFTFTDKLNPLDIAAIQETLQKNPHQLGNTVIVQMQTPTEQFQLNGKSAPLLKTLTDDLKTYQNIPELAKLQQVSNLLAVTDPEKSAQVNKLLEEYTKSNDGSNPQAFSEPITYSDLAKKISMISQPDQSENRRSNSKNISSGGGTGGGSIAQQTSFDASSNGSTNSKIESSPSTNLASGIPESNESKEKEPIKGYIGFFGDSNLEAFANPSRLLNLRDGGKGYAIRGHNTRQVLSQQMGLDSDGNPKGGKDAIPDLDKMEKIVINCGLNDVGSNIKVEEITKNLKTIVNYFLKKGKKVFLTTLSPFSGYTGGTLDPNAQRNGQSLEERRQAINNFILNDLKGQAGLRIIPLHLTKTEGGVASDKKDAAGFDALDSSFNSGDKLHFKPTEFAKLLTRYLNSEEPQSNQSVAATQTTSSNQPFQQIRTSNDEYWSKNVYGAPKGFSGGGVSQAAAIRSREILNKGGMKAGEYKEETIDGVTYAFVHEGHPKSSTDHSSWHPSISVYVKKDQKKSAKDNPKEANAKNA